MVGGRGAGGRGWKREHMLLNRHFPEEAQSGNIDCRLWRQSDLFSSSHIRDEAERPLNKCWLISNKWVMSWAGIHVKLWDLPSRLLHLTRVFFPVRGTMNCLKVLWGLADYHPNSAWITHSQISNYQLHASGQGQLHAGRQLAGPLCQQRGVSMTLSCPRSPAPSRSALEHGYQACVYLKTPRPMNEFSW